MLKIINRISKSRISHICKHISTSSVSWQGGEVVKAREQEDVIRVIEKKPQRLPLVKNFFAQRIDTDLLAYPEAILDAEQLELVTRKKAEYGDFLAANIFESLDDVNNIRKLKEYGAFRIPTSLVTELSFGISETDSQYLSYGTFLNNHQQVMKLVNDFGDPNQKLKYLPKLELGEVTGTPCMFEETRPGNNKKTFSTEAKYIDRNDEWILNGEKSFILMSPTYKDSTLFLVIASTESTDHLGDFKEGLVAMLVDGSLPGVSISKTDETIGYGEKAFNQVSVSFTDVTVTNSCVFSEDGFNVATSLLNSLRLQKGVQALSGVMKPMMKELTNHCINTKLQGIHLKDVDTIKEQLGALASHYYALESMVYMTAGLIDIYDKQDVEVECAMVHAYAMQVMTDFIVRPMYAIGPQAVVKGAGFDRFIRDAAQLAASGEHMDTVKQFIALAGLHHAGQILHDNVQKNRNPLNHPAFIFARIFNETSIESPKLKHKIDRFLHPSLISGAAYLEMSIIRLYAAVDILLGRHGSLVLQHSVEVAKIAEAATICYAMFAAAARASRSYCIGLRNADQEIHLANVICFQGSERVKKIAKDIDNGEYGTSEHTFKIVGEKMIETKEYHLEHPTTRNF